MPHISGYEPLDVNNMSYDETCYHLYGIDLDDKKYSKEKREALRRPNQSDQSLQDYQQGYHTGYDHGIHDASLLTAEDIMMISDIEFFELNNEENTNKTRQQIYERIAERFNKERKITKK